MTRQQQGLEVTKTDGVKPAKPFIPDKYNNRMERKKINRVK